MTGVIMPLNAHNVTVVLPVIPLGHAPGRAINGHPRSLAMRTGLLTDSAHLARPKGMSIWRTCKMKRVRHCILVFFMVVFQTPVSAQDHMNVFFIGHSLMSDVPGMTRSLVERHARQKFSFRHQDIPGAPLRWQWEAKDRSEQYERIYGGRYHVHLPSGKFDTLVITESVPRGGAAMEAETIDYLGRFVSFARTHRPDTRIFLYVTWPHLTSGTQQASPYDADMPNRHLKWRERIDADQVMWERIVATVNSSHPGTHPVRIIPGGAVLASLFDEISAGNIPEWSAIQHIFGDEIHTNHYGKYVMALTFFSALTGKSSMGAPSNIRGTWGEPIWNHRIWDGKIYPPPKAETVLKVQEVVDRVMLPSK